MTIRNFNLYETFGKSERKQKRYKMIAQCLLQICLGHVGNCRQLSEQFIKQTDAHLEEMMSTGEYIKGVDSILYQYDIVMSKFADCIDQFVNTRLKSRMPAPEEPSMMTLVNLYAMLNKDYHAIRKHYELFKATPLTKP